MIILLGFLLTFSTVMAKDKSMEIYADCSNYCAFKEFENNCHGIAFKEKYNVNGEEKANYYYTQASKDGCGYNLRSIKRAEIDARCPCEDTPPAGELPDKEVAMSEQTKEELKALKEKISQWVPCAPDPLTIPVPADDQKHYTPKDLKACKEMSDPYLVLGGCFEGTYFNHCSYYGNTNNYAGPLCYAGDELACETVKKNQNPETGAWYRSAYERRFPFAIRGQSLFSRDEFVGIMLYLVKTKDKVAAEKWLRFIANNPKKPMTGLGKLVKVFDICPPFPGPRPPHIPEDVWKRMQSDDRCEMRPDSWATMYKVYRYLGFSNKELKAIDKEIYRTMRLSNPLNGISSYLSSAFVPAVGYEQGNQATNILILRAVGTESSLLDSAAKLMDKRSGYESPYYHYLAQGNKATEYGAYLIKKYCPEKQPNYVNPPQGGIATPAAGFFDYAVHYFMGKEDGWQANLPTGHECVGWINLYLK